MINLTLTFDDLNGNPVTDTFYFNLNTAEVADWAAAHGEEEPAAYLQAILDTKDVGKMLKVYTDFVKMSVGRKSEDGRRFEKSDEIAADFLQTNAYDAFFHQLLVEEGFGINFIRGIMPKTLQNAAAAKNNEPAQQKPIEDYTVTELVALSDDDFNKMVSLRRQNMPKNLLIAQYNRDNK